MEIRRPKIEDYATIEAYVGPEEIPVYAFGYTYIYGLSPDLQPGAKMQDGNINPVVKFVSKKSWKIEHNLCGANPAREPKTMWNDDQPLLPIHLIDGDPETAWSSRGTGAPDKQPEWIRIDLPAESIVSSVALICSDVGPLKHYGLRTDGFGEGLPPGKALPKELTVKLSRDSRQWDTVYDNKDFSGPDSGASIIEFEPQPAKQIWIIANNFPYVQGWGYAISIGEVQVLDPEGNNLALVSRGAGVQVSSTHYGYGMNRLTQDMLWPIQYDLGFKWTRVGYDMGLCLWMYVEREKGKLQIDPKADAALAEAYSNGMNVILCLDKGNWLYHDPPRKVDWKKARVHELMETYYDRPDWPTASPELLEGYLRYVDYMVRHFKGRVAYYEICNEWAISLGPENYEKLVKATIPVIKKADPDARIMLGSPSGYAINRAILACLGGEPQITGLCNGKFAMHTRKMAVAEKVKEKDFEASVDIDYGADAGIILRFKDAKNYLEAKYDAVFTGSILIQEVIDDKAADPLGTIRCDGIGETVRLSARVDGADVTFTASDGKKVFTVAASCKDVGCMAFPGIGLGVTQDYSPLQMFDDFKVCSLDGRVIYEDGFDGPNGPIPDWSVYGPGWDVPISEPLTREEVSQLDAIGFHPFYQIDPDVPVYRNHRRDVSEFRKEAGRLGFAGQLVASEWTWAASYPLTHDWCTEMTKAKYASQLMAAHNGMDIVSLYVELFQTEKTDWDCSLLRYAVSVDPISCLQPQAIYYAFRNLCTALDGFRASEFPVTFSTERELDCYTFKKGEDRIMLAAWITGKTVDGIVEVKSDVTIPGFEAKSGRVFDIFNGTVQDLNIAGSSSETLLKDILIKDYPVIIELAK